MINDISKVLAQLMGLGIVLIMLFLILWGVVASFNGLSSAVDTLTGMPV